MLEVARALVANTDTQLRAPVLFLFNGGEESLLLASHGFMAHSKWASQLGAFINLESTGPGGPAYLFQHTGIPITCIPHPLLLPNHGENTLKIRLTLPTLFCTM